MVKSYLLASYPIARDPKQNHGQPQIEENHFTRLETNSWDQSPIHCARQRSISWLILISLNLKGRLVSYCMLSDLCAKYSFYYIYACISTYFIHLIARFCNCLLNSLFVFLLNAIVRGWNGNNIRASCYRKLKPNQIASPIAYPTSTLFLWCFANLWGGHHGRQ